MHRNRRNTQNSWPQLKDIRKIVKILWPNSVKVLRLMWASRRKRLRIFTKTIKS